jgi:cellulose synthase/poly-beta-1,6-N-acetylglucosamine synthase-like glycosyltransferase
LNDLINQYLLIPLYFIVWFLLSAFCLHRNWLVIQYFRFRNQQAGTRQPPPENYPTVLIQLPMFNERYVAERVIQAAVAIQYPADKLTIQVLDDSTDDTSGIVAELIQNMRENGRRIEHIQRFDREGYKAGALKFGMEQDHSELIAIFDADFIPTRDFLLNTVGVFSDPAVGMVQTRWEHTNRDYSLLTRIQAILLDGHFVIEHTSRSGMQCFFNFNGTAGIWRRSAIESAGGWMHDTLTEDLDLSYRSQLKGWKFIYLNDIKTPAELPGNIRDYKSQQERWTMGSIQTARKLLPRLITSRIPLKCKFEASVHLMNNHCYGLMLILTLLFAPIALQGGNPDLHHLLWMDIPFFLASTVSIVIFYLTASADGGEKPLKILLLMPLVMGVGIGMAINNTGAVMRGWLVTGGEFIRTPKSASQNLEESGGGRPYRNPAHSVQASPGYCQAGQILMPSIELFFLIYSLITFYLCFMNGKWLILPFIFLFVAGFGYVLGLTLVHLISSRFKTRVSRPTSESMSA